MAFGERLQEVRRENGLTQEQFAEALQVSRQAVSRWESGRSYPEVDKILYICNRYGVSLGTLFSEEVPLPDSDRTQAPQEVAAPPQDSLLTSLDSFITNLSPKSKWIGAGILAGAAVLALLIGLCLKGGSGDMSTIIWIAAIVIFGVVEVATVGLVSIWFVIGSVAGLVAAALDAPIWLQVVLFFLVSIAALIATRPLVKSWPIRARWPPMPTGCWAVRPVSPRPSTIPFPPARCISTARRGRPAASPARSSRRIHW